ncbi:AraC family transcriptional regulator [Pseudotenacibaculum sp. MALMAid0570]|uniref:helix-turn-helix domain-containing protein n=1 Tax=Pseudotenacibaculum sp. MALMAid0570 TaxID=3143938 RepID=UPI0032DF633D
MNTIDVYQFFKNHPAFNKLVGDDYLFVEYKCPINSEQFKLWSESDFISYVISGKKDWTSLHQKISTNEGEAVYIRKGVYNTKQYFEVDYCVMLFFVTDDFIRRFMNEFSTPKIELQNSYPQIFEIDVDDTLTSLFMTVFNYFKQGGNIPKDLVELKFKELFYNIALNPANKSIASFFQSLQNKEKANLDYIMMKNFHSDLTIEEYAKLSGRSLSSFKRDFKEYFKETPRKWINNMRLEYAKTLLENSQLNINEICYESGFKNSSHFNTAFKEKYKLPPRQFKTQVS